MRALLRRARKAVTAWLMPFGPLPYVNENWTPLDEARRHRLRGKAMAELAREQEIDAILARQAAASKGDVA